MTQFSEGGGAGGGGGGGGGGGQTSVPNFEIWGDQSLPQIFVWGAYYVSSCFNQKTN